MQIFAAANFFCARTQARREYADKIGKASKARGSFFRAEEDTTESTTSLRDDVLVTVELKKEKEWKSLGSPNILLERGVAAVEVNQ